MARKGDDQTEEYEMLPPGRRYAPEPAELVSAVLKLAEEWEVAADSQLGWLDGHRGPGCNEHAPTRLHWATVDLVTVARRLVAARKLPIGFDATPFHDFYAFALARESGRMKQAARTQAALRFNLAVAELDRLRAMVANQPISHSPPQGRPVSLAGRDDLIMELSKQTHKHTDMEISKVLESKGYGIVSADVIRSARRRRRKRGKPL